MLPIPTTRFHRCTFVNILYPSSIQHNIQLIIIVELFYIVCKGRRSRLKLHSFRDILSRMIPVNSTFMSRRTPRMHKLKICIQFSKHLVLMGTYSVLIFPELGDNLKAQVSQAHSYYNNIIELAIV